MNILLCRFRGASALFLRRTSTIAECPVHTDLLKVLVCPLTKALLRYDAVNNELVCDQVGVTYPILKGGIPNLYPQDGRLLKKEEKTT